MGLFNLFSSKKKKLKEYQDRGAIILDVRTKNEYNQGSIPGSKHIPMQQISSQISEIKKWNKPIITCCQSGVRSGSAAKFLRSNGIDAINGGGWSSLNRKL